ncbi:lipid A deacylase LpxR family protein [Thalassococcus sp. CAU 1522]|uniref:Lipid A deacylase LpxR family protein n=1 Tax=Thalassococcus arenae TaxID=2851652 RepID=A0ABS6N6W5_9RHOB|nr:lipid A-modifier LpxR family protein [Thalassococcus arenae]MBV2359533.1 lipid A deacylase LpxR family protein [Thalassococcus arenae]
MRSVLSLAIVVLVAFSHGAAAEGRHVLGYGRLVTNDSFVGTLDRWQTGSFASSRVRGRGWDGVLPDRPFEILEYRLGAQLMAPDNLRFPAAGDRPYAAALSLGMHTHFARGATEFALGGDLVFTGPQTRLGEVQTAVHDAFGITPATNSVLARQIGDAVYPTLVTEVGQAFAVGGQAVLRPFAELRWGAESLARIGADLTVGPAGQGELLVRDPVTGHRYRSVHNRVPGFSWVLGGDITHVADSVFLPDNRGVTAEKHRHRLRTGLHWQGDRHAIFYGVTWMSEEFEAQPEAQVVGSLRLNLRF